MLLLAVILAVTFAFAMGAFTWLGIGHTIRECLGTEFLKTEIGILLFNTTGVLAYIIVASVKFM